MTSQMTLPPLRWRGIAQAIASASLQKNIIYVARYEPSLCAAGNASIDQAL